MTITISPLTKDEITESVKIELEAFRSHPRTPAMWRDGYTPEVYAFIEHKKRDSFQDPDCRIMKAVDADTGRMVGIAEWTFELDPSKQADRDSVDPHGLPPPNWPPGGNWEMRRFFNLNSEKWTRGYMHGKQFIQLETLVINPESQGKGAGTKLLAWGVEQAESIGVPICVESTPLGLSLYKRAGFKVKDELRADMKQFGFDEPYGEDSAKRIWLIREPRGQD